MTAKKKVTWKSRVIPSCCKTSDPDQHWLPELKKQVSKQSNSSQRISLLDLSNSSSPVLSVDDLSNSLVSSELHVFSLAELMLITHNFSRSNLIGEGGFGPVYKGFVDDKLKPGLMAQPVAVKLLDSDGLQGHNEWLAEIIFLGQLRHPNLVKLIGYCWEEDYRLLVYEFMPRGSLESQLFSRYSATLPWSTRMKIALEAAKGLEFLHEADPPVIYRDFKPSNILLNSDYTAKLSDFGLAKDSPEEEEDIKDTSIMGTQGYAAPEYVKTGHLTIMNDVYSFGVVLLELLTGKCSINKTYPSRHGRQSVVEWTRTRLKDPKKLNLVIDQRLEGQYSAKGARKAAGLAYKCLSRNPKRRPCMNEVVNVLKTLQNFDDLFVGTFVYVVPNESYNTEDCIEERKKDNKNESKIRATHSLKEGI